MPVQEVLDTLSGEAKSRMAADVKAFDLVHPPLERICPEVYKGRKFAAKADPWQECYLIWGAASLKMRYPLTHGPLTKEERVERKRKRRWARIEQERRDATSGRRLDWELTRNCIHEIQGGVKLPRGVIRYCAEQFEYSSESRYLLESDYYDGGMHQYVG